MYVSHYPNETVLCNASAICSLYGERDFPVITFYDDGSFSHMERGVSYFRSQPGRLPKPRHEYTLNELRDILKDITLLYKGM